MNQNKKQNQSQTQTEDAGALASALEDPRLEIETAFTKLTGVSITVVTSFISIVSCITIMYLVLISEKGLRSPYHRIMFASSIYIMVSMIAAMFSTLLMPKDMIYEQFDGIVLGNQATCNAQGFLYVVGTNGSGIYNSGLCLYFLCSIRYKFLDEEFSKCIEKVLHIFAIASSTAAGAHALSSRFINPSPFGTWCGMFQYPWWCEENDLECSIRNTARKSDAPAVVVAVLFSALTFIWLVMTICSVYFRERMYVSYTKQHLSKSNTESNTIPTANTHENTTTGTLTNTATGIVSGTASGIASNAIAIEEHQEEPQAQDNNNNNEKDFTNDLKLTKHTTKLAFAYVASFSAVYILIIFRTTASPEHLLIQGDASQMFFLFFRPLQGFFNLVIFLYGKVHQLKRRETEITLPQALKAIFTGEHDEEEYVISKISLVRDDQRLHFVREQERNQRHRLRLVSEDSSENNRGEWEDTNAVDLLPDASVKQISVDQDLSGFGSTRGSIGAYTPVSVSASVSAITNKIRGHFHSQVPARTPAGADVAAAQPSLASNTSCNVSQASGGRPSTSSKKTKARSRLSIPSTKFMSVYSSSSSSKCRKLRTVHSSLSSKESTTTFRLSEELIATLPGQQEDSLAAAFPVSTRSVSSSVGSPLPSSSSPLRSNNTHTQADNDQEDMMDLSVSASEYEREDMMGLSVSVSEFETK